MRALVYSIFLIAVYLLFKEDGVSPVFIVPMMLPLLLFGWWLKIRDRKSDQTRRNSAARSVLQAAGLQLPGESPNARFAGNSEQQRDGKNKAVLFLRPFTADLVEVYNPERDKRFRPPLYNLLLPSTVSLDDGLRYCLSADAHFLAISLSDDRLGAVPVVSGHEDWKDAFGSLTAIAKHIVVVPGARAGTEWEICQLKERGLLDRCIFLLLPLPTLIEFENAPAFRFDSVLEVLTRSGYRLGELNDLALGDGLMFDKNANVVCHYKGLVAQGKLSNTLSVEKIRWMFELREDAVHAQERIRQKTRWERNKLRWALGFVALSAAFLATMYVLFPV